jgi:DHA2 family methylenomycin A resistance protein-like MFS transporter
MAISQDVLFRPAAAPSQAMTLAATSLGFVVVQLDVTIVNVALERIGTALGTGVAGLQWVVNAYTVVFASLILSSGALGDRLGAKRLFIIGFAIFTAASVACGGAPNFMVLVTSRAIQGIGAAILVPCSLALLSHTFRDEAARARAVGIWAGGAGVALAAGPVIGGVLIAGIGWRSIFFINLPVGLMGIWMTVRYAEETGRPAQQGLDPAGQFLGIAALADLAATIIEGGKRGWTDPLVILGCCLFAVLASGFIAVEKTHRAPLLPLSFFCNRTFTVTTVIGLLINSAFYGLIFVLSLFFQKVQKATPLATGLMFLPPTAIIIAANVIAGRIAAKIGARMPMIAGQAVFAAGCFCLLSVDAGTAYGRIWWPLVMIGAGIGLTVPPMTSALLGTVERVQSGVASGVLNTARQAGSVIGVALFGSLIAHPAGFIAGFHLALLVSVGALLIGCILAALIPR